MTKIIVVRHGQKDGDKLTGLGAQQAYVAAQAIAERFGKVDQFHFSGAHRTSQTIRIMAAAMGQFVAVFVVNDGFHFGDVVEANGGIEAFEPAVAKINEAGGTLKAALEIYPYATAARLKLTDTLVTLAEEAGEDAVILAASHSPYAEVAALDLETPFGLGECDAVAYTVEGGVVISSELIKAPIEGAKNT